MTTKKLKQKQKLIIPLSENDLQELEFGKEFHWTFTTNKGEDIDVHLRLETQEDIDGDVNQANDMIDGNGDMIDMDLINGGE